MKIKLIDMIVRLYSHNKYHRNASKAVRELSACTDAELKDIGISRYDIVRSVRCGIARGG